jgi:hypothetical protein
MEALPYIVQIALFGAAGTCFVFAHLKNLAAGRADESQPAAERWRVFRLPQLRRPQTPAQHKLRRDALAQSLFGFVFLIGAFVAPYVFSFLQIGA